VIEALHHSPIPHEPGYDGPQVHTRQPGYDGRLLRGERTRHRIAEALIELVEEGDPKPTAKLIAAKADVSLRLVFHHFDDVDAIFREGSLIQIARHWQKVVTISPTGGVQSRIEDTVRQRRQLFEAISPVRRAAVARAVEDTVIAELLVTSYRRLRRELASTFEPELTAAGDDAAILLEALGSASSWDAWNMLRVIGGKSAAATAGIVRHTLTALLR
jgi:AcrR family transcriptional regulator